MSGTDGVTPPALSSRPSMRQPLPTGPQPREVVEALRLAAEGDRASRASVVAKPNPLATIKRLTDGVPLPVVFISGAIFGLLFAASVLGITRPAASAAPVSASAEVDQEAQARAALQVRIESAAPQATEAAPFVAWDAPPAMPATDAPAAAPARRAARAHVSRVTTKRALARSAHGKKAAAKANMLTAAL